MQACTNIPPAPTGAKLTIDGTVYNNGDTPPARVAKDKTLTYECTDSTTFFGPAATKVNTISTTCTENSGNFALSPAVTAASLASCVAQVTCPTPVPDGSLTSNNPTGPYNDGTVVE